MIDCWDFSMVPFWTDIPIIDTSVSENENTVIFLGEENFEKKEQFLMKLKCENDLFTYEN